MNYELDKTEFASGAEAVAHYYKQGFQTADYRCEDNARAMKRVKGDYEITIAIRHVGLLHWIVKVVDVYEWAGDWNNQMSRHHY